MEKLSEKISIAENNIGEWYEYWEGAVYIACSGGKDSIALTHIAHKLYPDIPTVFCDTGLEYPDVRESAISKHNSIRLKPDMKFGKVIEKYGYPIISKDVADKVEQINTSTSYIRNLRLTNYINGAALPIKYHYLIEAPFKVSGKCCTIMKKRPFAKYELSTGRKPIIGVMGADSLKRKKSWHTYGCNAFELKKPQSRPIMSWHTSDVWKYIAQENLKYPGIYDTGMQHTGCMFCGFGVYYDQAPNRYEMLKNKYPAIYRHVIDKLGFDRVLDFIGVKY